MNRIDRMLAGLDRGMALVEVGPSHSPIVPKAAGWNTVVVDYADAGFLREHYKHESHERIEDVDVVWRSGRMHEAFPPRALAAYDAVISSHSLEHMPDAIGFLQSCEKLIKADGIIKLALPDKRCCFDFFSGLSTSGDMLSAHHNKDKVHSKRTSFNEVAYATKNGGSIGWSITDKATDLELMWPLDFAYAVFQRASSENAGEYFDFHAWKFTPSSFELIIEEVGYLGAVGLRIAEISETVGHEFFVTLRKAAGQKPEASEFNKRRLALLKKSMGELSRQIANMG